ncbi:MAG: glutamate--tRNA ligase family protein, partial [Candidatus Nanoarchaeia archaeon]
MNKKDLENKTRAYALKNAISHDGKAQQGAVMAGLFNEGLKKTEVKKHIKDISEIISEINKLPLNEQKEEFEKLKDSISERKIRQGLQELPNVKKSGVVMRFAPSASGQLHIGHAMTASLSYLYVKKYGGKFYIRIEDTNPENVYKPAYEMIKDEVKWLFGNNVKIFVQSDRMKIYYKYAEKLIKKNVAYVCTCSQEAFKNHISSKTNCPCRSLKVKENLLRWKNM